MIFFYLKIITHIFSVSLKALIKFFSRPFLSDDIFCITLVIFKCIFRISTVIFIIYVLCYFNRAHCFPDPNDPVIQHYFYTRRLSESIERFEVLNRELVDLGNKLFLQNLVDSSIFKAPSSYPDEVKTRLTEIFDTGNSIHRTVQGLRGHDIDYVRVMLDASNDSPSMEQLRPLYEFYQRTYLEHIHERMSLTVQLYSYVNT